MPLTGRQVRGHILCPRQNAQASISARPQPVSWATCPQHSAGQSPNTGSGPCLSLLHFLITLRDTNSTSLERACRCHQWKDASLYLFLHTVILGLSEKRGGDKHSCPLCENIRWPRTKRAPGLPHCPQRGPGDPKAQGTGGRVGTPC